ncbi:COP9 signalosome complex subunit 1 [Cyphellophora attinorum]|uniref:COP9 signalosome complex subunit 1 n=1 Tax=Cyphellophora attinorum TaxID=1664694 RepID=A0A0N0NRN2_9EURO|nr:COP9 signalosome complex subunit 1 [Phialophora attinorum]KPI45039.1 COP9 signalosome complex subunit 1 [Phialophora attinorum]
MADFIGATPASPPSSTITVNEAPKFELTSYISNYRGRTVFRRLYLIGACCPPLREEAAKLAIREARRGSDLHNLEEAIKLLQTVPNYRDTENLLDTSWAVDVEKKNAKETQRLENELKGYKNNLIKESIRVGKMGNEDLGIHYQDLGDLINASKAFGRMRDFCTTPAHISQTAFHIIDVAVEQRNWMAVQSQVVKIQALQMKPEESRHQRIVTAINGLQRMCNGEYKDAAFLFLSCDPAISELGQILTKFMTLNDIAVYGGLCALATMSRSELQARVLDNPSFRNFLELEPHIRRATSFFVACKYTQCLEILESYRNDYLLDLYLQPHVDRLYRRVREKSIVQYFEPFGSVRLENMEKVFGEAAVKTTTNNAATTNGVTHISITLLDELVTLIEEGKLNARLDMEKNLLVVSKPDARVDTYKEAERTLDNFTKDAYLKLMRITMANAGLETKAPTPSKKKGASALDWEDENGWSMDSTSAKVGGGYVLVEAVAVAA